MGTTPLSEGVAEKIEAVAWGPDLPDGRRLLYLVSDNDLFAGDGTHEHGLPTQIYAFAINESQAGVAVVPQNCPGRSSRPAS